MRQAWTSILLSTLFVGLGPAVWQCGRNGAVPRPAGTVLEIYDRAVSLYFRAPRRPEKAITLLEGACTHIKEQRAQSCYNWGLLMELEKDRRGALKAYRRAAELDPLDVYRAAVAALDASERPVGKRPNALQRAVLLCAERKAADAFAVLKEASAGDHAGWTRELVAQPVFRECLGSVPGYRAFAAGLPGTTRSLTERHRAAMAARDHFHGLWDIEARLAGHESGSRHPVTAAWHQALRYAARGDGAATGRTLQEFLRALPKTGKDAGRSRGMARAAGLVVQQTRYFAGVRSHPDVRRFLDSAL